MGVEYDWNAAALDVCRPRPIRELHSESPERGDMNDSFLRCKCAGCASIRHRLDVLPERRTIAPTFPWEAPRAA